MVDNTKKSTDKQVEELSWADNLGWLFRIIEQWDFEKEKTKKFKLLSVILDAEETEGFFELY